MYDPSLQMKLLTFYILKIMSLCALQGTSRSDYDIEVLNGNEHEYIEMVNESISNEL